MIYTFIGLSFVVAMIIILIWDHYNEKKIDKNIDEEFDRLDSLLESMGYKVSQPSTFTSTTCYIKKKFKRDFTKRFYPKRLRRI